MFDLGGELSIPGYSLVKTQDVARLEETLDKLNAHLTPLKEFILPGGCRSAAFCHQARSVCRRVERRLLAVNDETPVSATSLAYVNRLSDLLFVTSDVLWHHERKAP